MGYGNRFNRVGNSSTEGAAINHFSYPRKKNIDNLDLARQYLDYPDPQQKVGSGWMKNPEIIRNMTKDLEFQLKFLKNKIKGLIKKYYEDKKYDKNKQVDPSIIALKKIYQNDLGGEEIYGS